MKHKKTAVRILSIACIALAWEVIAWRTALPELFPPLGGLFVQVLRLFGTPGFYTAVGASVCRGMAGLLIALASSFLLGTLAAFSPFWHTFFHPIVVLLRSVPVISFILLALLWFSPEGLPVFIALATIFPMMYQNIYTALRQTDPKLVEMAQVFGKTPLNRFTHICLPAAKDLIFDGVSTAAGFGWRAIIMGEALAQPLHGIGSGMKEAQAFIQVPRLMAWTIAAILIGYAFEWLLQKSRQVNRTHRYPTPRPYAHPAPPAPFVQKSIQMQNLHKQFGNHTIFDNTSLTFDNRTATCIKGASGRGKTTLLRLVARLDTDYRGTICYPESYTLSYAFQEPRLLPWLNVRDNIAYVLPAGKRNRQASADLTAYLLRRLHLAGQAEKYPHQLSGGQQQRVNLARALAARADILLLDEPLTGMDEALKAELIRFIPEWLGTYRPVTLWATHEDIPDTVSKTL